MVKAIGWLLGVAAFLCMSMLVMVLVVYLAYSELRACGRCLFSYRKRQQEDGARAAAMLTRPFTLAITMLASIDSVMTVLIARDLLTQAGMDDTTPLLAVPAASNERRQPPVAEDGPCGKATSGGDRSVRGAHRRDGILIHRRTPVP